MPISFASTQTAASRNLVAQAFSRPRITGGQPYCRTDFEGGYWYAFNLLRIASGSTGFTSMSN